MVNADLQFNRQEIQKTSRDSQAGEETKSFCQVFRKIVPCKRVDEILRFLEAWAIESLLTCQAYVFVSAERVKLNNSHISDRYKKGQRQRETFGKTP